MGKLALRLFSKFDIGRFGALAGLIFLLFLRILDPTPIKIVRYQSFDIYQRMKPRVYVRQPVAIVDIDEKSIREIGQWPWPRTRMAQLVTKLTEMSVAAIGFDILFSEPDRLSPGHIADDNPSLPQDVRDALRKLPSNDAGFATAIGRSRIVLGQTSVRSRTDLGDESRGEVPDVPHAMIGNDATQYLPPYPPLVQNLPELESVSKGHGVFTVTPDEDGIFRHVPLVLLVEDKLRLSLSAELLRVATGKSAFAIKSNDAGVEGIKIGRIFVETDRTGTVWPYFTHSQPQRFVSATDILNGKVDPKRLRGHLVLVGTSAVGLEDYRATPMSSLMAGVEIHAQVIENILTKQMLVRPNYAIAFELLAILALGLLAIIFVPMLGASWSFICSGILLLSYMGFSYYVFFQHRLLIDPTYPTISAALIIIILTTFNYLREEKQRRQIRSAFGQYVSPDLVAKLADNPGTLELGGDTRELSVLFSDVRGFTAISESYKHNPQGLTQLMNAFLTVLSKAILKRQGTIDKFMGDAVMAFWNAPLNNDDHARDACLAALEMIQDVTDLNKRKFESYSARKEAGTGEGDIYHEINVGIGINTGTCVVGNMGSEDRFDYTALGDTVNLASRLEGQSKPYGIKIILGEGTARYVRDEMATLEVDRIRVKGKQDPETIFALMGNSDLATNPKFEELRRLNQSMLVKYREQDWESAAALVELLGSHSEEMGIDLETYLFIYELRIAEFSQNPPGREWNGVYVATSK